MKKLSMVLLLLAIGSVVWAQGKTETASTTSQQVPSVTQPVTIQVWHTRGAGANGDMISSSVEEFNRTNTLGITVEEVYQGGYPTTLAKTMQAVAAGTNPQIVVLERAAGVPVLAEQNVLMDMTPFIERDGLDMGNFPEVLLGFSHYNNQIISLPYIRSTPVFYYNADMFEAAGLTAPQTIDELVAAGKKLTKVVNGKTEVHGFELLIDAGWFIQNMLVQMGSNLLSEDGLSVPALEDGTMLKALKAWRQWVDEGWTSAPIVTNASSAMLERFYQGKLASFFTSSGSMSNILRNAKNAGINVGVAFLPTWDKPSAPTGGGNIAIIGRNSTGQQKAAAWEFVKFLMSDEQVARNSAATGYLPTTHTSVSTQVIKDLWAATPQFRVPFDQLAIAQELPWSKYKSEFEVVLNTICSELIQDRSITAEQAVAKLKTEASIIFPASR